MSVHVAAAPVPAKEQWMSISSPAAGSGWSVTVPAGVAWKLHGGGCRFHADATAGERVPYVTATVGGYTVFHYYNDQNGAAGVLANLTQWICYHPQEALVARAYTSPVPMMIGLPTIWLPPGTVITGGFTSMGATDQADFVGLMVETVAA